MDVAPLFTLLDALRHPETGCPWDREQTPATMAGPIRNEAEELATALERGDRDAIREEAGDVLWNLLTLLHMAKEAGDFTPEECVATVEQKMIGRHPHVFGSAVAADAEEARQIYLAAKQRRKDAGAV